MDENMNKEETRTEEIRGEEYVSEEEARTLWQLFRKNLKSYKEKDESVSDEQWLAQMLRREMPEMGEEEADADAREIKEAIKGFDENLEAVNEAAKRGVSKEKWLASKLQEASVGMSVQEYGDTLEILDEVIAEKNAELYDKLMKSTDGDIHVNRNPNLDGYLGEDLLAETTNISAKLQGKNVRVDVLSSNKANSVDLRAWDLDSGKYQNYQVKFGKDAKATIELIERGDYSNQRIIVPTEQLEEVQAHFEQKGSQKTITDHIEIAGVKSKRFTKEEMKQLQNKAQETNDPAVLNYDHYQTADLAMEIGKNAGLMALQSAAVITGVNVAAKIVKGEKIDADEMVEIALKTGADTSIKTLTAGTLQVAVRKGIIKIIPQATPAGVIANIACVGIENAKIFMKIASGELSLTKGIDQMGRVTVSMAAGLMGMARGAVVGALIGGIFGAPIAVLGGIVGGMVGYAAGAKIGEVVYDTAKKVAGAARDMVRGTVNAIKSVGRRITRGIKSLKKAFR